MGGYTDTETVWRSLLFLLSFLDCFPYFEKYKKFWEELFAYFPLIRHRQHRKHVQQFFYRYMCIRCRGNVLRTVREHSK
jgi:hypothetical protein